MSNCELWTGALNDRGYGQSGSVGLAHRAAFALANPSIDISDLHIHHLCGIPACIKVAHLEAMDPKEHHLLHTKLRREIATLCVNGHEWKTNEGWQKDRNGYENRYCMECARIKARRNYAKNHVPKSRQAPSHCPANHEYTPENVKHYKRPNGKTKLSCRECNRLRAEVNRKK